MLLRAFCFLFVSPSLSAAADWPANLPIFFSSALPPRRRRLARACPSLQRVRHIGGSPCSAPAASTGRRYAGERARRARERVGRKAAPRPKTLRPLAWLWRLLLFSRPRFSWAGDPPMRLFSSIHRKNTNRINPSRRREARFDDQKAAIG